MPSKTEEDIRDKLRETEKSYRNSYIIAGVFVLFMIVMLIIAYYPMPIPLRNDSMTVSPTPDILSDVTLEKKLFGFDIPVDVRMKLEPTGAGEEVPKDTAIYFLARKDAEDLRFTTDVEELESHSLGYQRGREEISFSTALEPDVPYTFLIMREGDNFETVEATAVYDMDCYPVKPYLPFIIGIGVIGCTVPLVYIVLDSRKKRTLEGQLSKKKKARRKQALRRQGSPVPGSPQPPGIPGQTAAPVAYNNRNQQHLQYILQQLQVLKQQEGVVQNQLRMAGPREQKVQLLKRYEDIQTQKTQLEKQVIQLQQDAGGGLTPPGPATGQPSIPQYSSTAHPVRQFPPAPPPVRQPPAVGPKPRQFSAGQNPPIDRY